LTRLYTDKGACVFFGACVFIRIQVSLGHPAYIARMKSSPDKTDFSDGRLLADLTRVGYLPCVWLAPQSIRELRQLSCNVSSGNRVADAGLIDGCTGGRWTSARSVESCRSLVP
jgi:hypothetical protein